MNTRSGQPDKTVIGDFHDELVKAERNSTCLYPGCNGKPIGSHLIPEKTLKLIADKSKVFTWNPSFTSMVRNIEAGQAVEQLYSEPILVGIKDIKKVTYPLFCDKHDGPVFAPLEKGAFSSQPEQILLLAFRALCSMTYSAPATEPFFNVAKKYGYQHSLSTPDKLPKLLRYLAREIVLETRRQHAEMLLAHSYNRLDWAIFTVNMQPCVACSYTLIPVDDIDSLAIVNGSEALTAEDVLVFSLLPHQTLKRSTCVISWLRGSQRAEELLSFYKINQLSDKEQQDLMLSFAFQSPHIYISPSWWRSLSEEQRKEYAELQFYRHEEFTRLI